MIEIIIKNELGSVINKEIIVNKFAKTCNDIGLDVGRYVLTEYFENSCPIGYKIELYRKEKNNG